MYNYISNIKKIAKQKNISLKHLAKEAGMSEVGFHQSLKNNSLKLEKLLKICEVLGVPPGELLSDGFSKKDLVRLEESRPLYGMTDREILEKIYNKVAEIERLTKNKGS